MAESVRDKQAYAKWADAAICHSLEKMQICYRSSIIFSVPSVEPGKALSARWHLLHFM